MLREDSVRLALDRVWDTVTTDLPALVTALERIQPHDGQPLSPAEAVK